MKLISWNVSARVKDVSKQVKALILQEPHVVALRMSGLLLCCNMNIPLLNLAYATLFTRSRIP